MEYNKDLETCMEHHSHARKVESAKKRMPDDERIASLSDLFRIFGDATRIRILEALLTEELCVCDIAEALGMTVSAISHQLRLLKQAHLVKARRDGKTVYYSLADAHVETMLAQGMEHIAE